MEIFNQIFEKSKNKNEAKIDGVTPLHLAAEIGHFSICKLIIEHVKEKNPEDNIGWTPLHRAAENGHLEICQLITENAPDKNPKDVEEMTPLHCAAEKGHLEIVRHIIEVSRMMVLDVLSFWYEIQNFSTADKHTGIKFWPSLYKRTLIKQRVWEITYALKRFLNILQHLYNRKIKFLAF